MLWFYYDIKEIWSHVDQSDLDTRYNWAVISLLLTVKIQHPRHVIWGHDNEGYGWCNNGGSGTILMRYWLFLLKQPIQIGSRNCFKILHLFLPGSQPQHVWYYARLEEVCALCLVSDNTGIWSIGVVRFSGWCRVLIIRRVSPHTPLALNWAGLPELG